MKYNIIENKLDDYVNSKRNEIYARMKLPKALVNHYITSASMSNWSVSEQNPYDIFDNNDTNASKDLEFDRISDIDMEEPAKRLAILNGKDSKFPSIIMEGNNKRKGFALWWTNL